MTSVLTAVPRQRGEGRGGRSPSAAGSASRSGRPTSTEPTSSSPSRATRSGSGCWPSRTSAQGAIESIIAAREEGGPFRSLDDFCSRIDLRLANRKVLESLARVGALNAFGHPAQVLLGLDDAIAAGARPTQRDRVTGQTSLFDLAPPSRLSLDAPLPNVPEAPLRERLRWEKELLGLYLSDHPMGEVADASAATSPPTRATWATSRSTASASSSAGS